MPITKKLEQCTNNTPSAGEFVVTGNTTSTRTQTFTVPNHISTISVLCVAGGGGGGAQLDDTYGAQGGNGGQLRYIYDLPVTGGETLTVTAAGGQIGKTANGDWTNNDNDQVSGVFRGANALIKAQDGSDGTPVGAGPYGGTVGGGEGGGGGIGIDRYSGGGGGGAAGYSGNGGTGAYLPDASATAGTGGAGGGGGGNWVSNYGGAGGGGVGLYGEGTSGAAGGNNTGGGGGSGGVDGNDCITDGSDDGATGGLYGGGGGGGGGSSGDGGRGAAGAVRIIWGFNRAYPATNIDVASSLGQVYLNEDN